MITQLEYGIHNLRAVYMYYRVTLTEYTLYRFVLIFINSGNFGADSTKFHVDITQSWSLLTNINWFDLVYWWVSYTGFEVWFYVRTIYDAFNPYDAILRNKNCEVTKKGWVSMLYSSPSTFQFILHFQHCWFFLHSKVMTLPACKYLDSTSPQNYFCACTRTKEMQG